RPEAGTESAIAIEEAVEGLAREGDLDDLRAFVKSVDPKLGNSAFVLLAHAWLGDRSDVDAIVAALDKDQVSHGKHASGVECSIAMAYGAIGDDRAADARLTEAHPDCPTYLAEQAIDMEHLDRARAILEAAAAHPPTAVFGEF